ncbi:hypothetical protein AALP_AA1G048700 [Arabis alpina]|uniref:Peroxidase n=1 Tax=Arabis alpina TaxID=50452 RepID=A0A087HL59_ARAAL|nr:hypothetical protein AALP_AA1G048700 [Arabis alpina]
MAIKNILSLVVLVSILGVSVAIPYPSLDLNYYRSKCPDAEGIVRNVTLEHVGPQKSLAAALLRMYFHDCFVRGCDASLLLKSPNNDAERDAIPNLSVRGYEVVDAAKKKLEEECPGIVSCADVLALVARDAVLLIGGPWWSVPLGRRDGRISRKDEANLPSPFADIATLKKNFTDKGLSVKDLVVLSGAHTIGISTCGLVNLRIYNFTANGGPDPAMNPSYVGELKQRCKPNDFTTTVDMDPGSVAKFDTDYFKAVSQKKGLFISDSALLNDLQTSLYITTQLALGGRLSTFNQDFAESMVRLGNLDVLTGNNGEIRATCASVN